MGDSWPSSSWAATLAGLRGEGPALSCAIALVAGWRLPDAQVIRRFITLPGDARAVIRLHPAERRLQLDLVDLDPDLTATERQAASDAAVGAARRLAREHGVRGASINLEVEP